MKVTRAQVAKNRAKILKVASRLFRERGIDGVNVAQVMAAAGLTHGAFYGYFESKEALVAASLQESKSAMEPVTITGRTRFIKNYLSPRHRDRPGRGCLFPALATEAARQPTAVREVFTARLKLQLDRLTQEHRGTPAARRRAAIADWSSMIGAVVLARLVDDPTLSAEILQTMERVLVPEAK